MQTSVRLVSLGTAEGQWRHKLNLGLGAEYMPDQSDKYPKHYKSINAPG